MLKELDVASRKGEARKEKERSKKKGKPEKPDPKMRKIHHSSLESNHQGLVFR